VDSRNCKVDRATLWFPNLVYNAHVIHDCPAPSVEIIIISMQCSLSSRADLILSRISSTAILVCCAIIHSQRIMLTRQAISEFGYMHCSMWELHLISGTFRVILIWFPFGFVFVRVRTLFIFLLGRRTAALIIWVSDVLRVSCPGPTLWRWYIFLRFIFIIFSGYTQPPSSPHLTHLLFFSGV